MSSITNRLAHRPPRAPTWPFWAAFGSGILTWLVARPLLHSDLFGATTGLWELLKAALFGPIPVGTLEHVVTAMLTVSMVPLLVGALLHWRRRRAWLRDRRMHPVPEVVGRAIRDEDGLAWRIAGSYGLHVLVMVGMVLMARGCAQRLGPPGGGGGETEAASEAPEQVEEVKVQQVRRRKLVVNPNSAIILKQPDEVPIDLREMTKELVKTKKLGGAGTGPGAGYEGGQGAALRFVTINHGGRGWDDGNLVAAPNLLREVRARIGVPTANKPDSVTVRDLAAQSDPDQQPPMVYMGFGNEGPRFSPSDHEFLRRYAIEIGGLILVDDNGGGRRHAEALAQSLFPGQPLVALPQDDRIFNIRESMASVAPEERALAKHGGDRIMGVSDGKRWLMIYHPGDLLDGWRGAYGVRWQESAFRFGVNVFHYATVTFTRIRAAERERKKNAP